MELFKKKIQGSGTTEIIISNVEIEKIMKIVNSLEESVLLIKGVGEAIENEAKEQKGRLIYLYWMIKGWQILLIYFPQK